MTFFFNKYSFGWNALTKKKFLPLIHVVSQQSLQKNLNQFNTCIGYIDTDSITSEAI